MAQYNHTAIESKWRENWEKNPINVNDGKKEKYYCLDMFPYPSGSGLHVGHWRGYVISDVWSRYQLLKGKYVIHPMGWDAFGLPAENYAIKMGVHPAISTEANIKNIKRQINEIASIYDWDMEVNTTDPGFYKWTQWIFVQMFKKGLAYEKEFPINWCPSCKTGLANEEVVNGCCERCGTTVTKKNLRQWMLKITAYADRLLADLDKLDWPEKVKKMQAEWIGKSHGAEVNFKVDKEEAQPQGTVLKINDLVVKDSRKISAVDGLSLEVRAGEILGIAGIDGNGQSELVEALTGLRKCYSGSITINGHEIVNNTPKQIFKKGIKNIPEDRHKRGLVLDFTVSENSILQNYKDSRFSKNSIINKDAMNEHAKSIISRFDVRPTDYTQKTRALSGGNQQKIIIGREVMNIERSRKETNEPQLLIATQPTRGLDVGAIEFVHKALVEQRDAGNAVLLVSLELDEVMNVSDRIAVMYEGKIVGIVDAKTTDENTLGLMMAGGAVDGK